MRGKEHFPLCNLEQAILLTFTPHVRLVSIRAELLSRQIFAAEIHVYVFSFLEKANSRNIFFSCFLMSLFLRKSEGSLWIIGRERVSP